MPEGREMKNAMKIAVIGANGNLGRRVTRHALEEGCQVKAVIRSGGTPDERTEVVRKSLFDLKKEDIADCDVMISAYGSGFHADPELNHEAFMKYIALNCRSRKSVER